MSSTCVRSCGFSKLCQYCRVGPVVLYMSSPCVTSCGFSKLCQYCRVGPVGQRVGDKY
jgi:hypothetical protein